MQKLLFISFLSALVSQPAVLADEDPIRVQRPFLWKIESIETGHTTTREAWLFGTIHVPDENITELHPVAKKAWDDSGAAFFEIDFVKQAEAQTKAISLPDDKKLSEIVPQELVERLDERLRRISPLMTRSVLPNVHVVVWPLLLGNLDAQVRKLGQLPMDVKLYTEATAKGKTVGGLEAPDSQLKPLISLPIEDQIAFLKSTLDAMDEDDKDKIDRLEMTMRIYARGNAKEFSDFIESELARTKMKDDLRDRIFNGIMTGRNRKMADAIVENMKASPDVVHFFAVGSGHLVGRNTVQEYLRRLRVQVARVPVEANDKEAQEPSR